MNNEDKILVAFENAKVSYDLVKRIAAEASKPDFSEEVVTYLQSLIDINKDLLYKVLEPQNGK